MRAAFPDKGLFAGEREEFSASFAEFSLAIKTFCAGFAEFFQSKSTKIPTSISRTARTDPLPHAKHRRILQAHRTRDTRNPLH